MSASIPVASTQPGSHEARAAAKTSADPGRTDFAEWLLYDGTCRFCTRSVRRWRHILARRGIGSLPLQTPWVERIVGTAWNEMKLLTRDGQLLGGIDAAIHLARRIGWLRPLAWVARFPGMRRLMASIYRWVADHRYCVAGRCELNPPGG